MASTQKRKEKAIPLHTSAVQVKLSGSGVKFWFSLDSRHAKPGAARASRTVKQGDCCHAGTLSGPSYGGSENRSVKDKPRGFGLASLGPPWSSSARACIVPKQYQK